MTTHTVTIDEKFLYSFGSNSLIGFLLNIDETKSLFEISEVILKFPQSSRRYCEKNKGPHEYIVSDYAIPLLIEDLIWLSAHNIKYKIEYYETDYEQK